MAKISAIKTFPPESKWGEILNTFPHELTSIKCLTARVRNTFRQHQNWDFISPLWMSNEKYLLAICGDLEVKAFRLIPNAGQRGKRPNREAGLILLSCFPHTQTWTCDKKTKNKKIDRAHTQIIFQLGKFLFTRGPLLLFLFLSGSSLIIALPYRSLSHCLFWILLKLSKL